MPIPSIFTPDRERPITSFDFIDIAKNRAVEVFYGGVTLISGSQLLTNNKFYSGAVSTFARGTFPGFTKELDIDFDTTFDVPLVIDGDAIINVPITVQPVTTGFLAQAYVIVSILKVSAGQTEVLGTVQSNTIQVNDSTTAKESMLAVTTKIDNIKFRKGDTLRLKTELYGQGTDVDYWLAHSPNNQDTNNTDGERTWTSVVTTLQMQLPIRIDI